MQAVAKRKLPISVFWESFVFPFAHFGAVFRIFFFPTLLLIAIGGAILWYFSPPGADFSTPEGFQAYLLTMAPVLDFMNIILVIFGMMFAVHIHRYIVNQEDPGWVLFRFGRYELMYLLTAIVIFVSLILAILAIVLAVMLILGVSLDPEMWARLQSGGSVPLPMPQGWFIAAAVVLYCFFIWIVVRLVLMLPHAAVAGRVSFAASWRAMKGNFWRFVLACLLFALLVMAVVLLLVGVGYLGIQTFFGWVLTPGAQVAPEQLGAVMAVIVTSYALMAVIWIFYFSMTVALISYAYAYLIGSPGQETAAMPGAAMAPAE